MHVPHLLFRSARRRPDSPLWLLEGGEISYGEGARRVARLAHALLDLVGRGGRVAILSTNRFEGLETWLACGTAGIVPVPLNPRLHPDEYAFIVEDSGSRAFFYDTEYEPVVETLRDRCLEVDHWITFGPEYEALQEARLDEPPDVAIEPEEVAWLFYTSGTTGKPKGAMETHRNLLTMTQQFLLGVVPDAEAGDVMFHAAPISHGTCSCMLPHLAVGAANAFPLTRAFDAAAILDGFERYGVTSTFLAPTMIHMLLQSGEHRGRDLSRLKSVIYGGGPMHVELLREALAELGPVLVQVYGQGEAPMTIASLPKEEHVTEDDPLRLRRLASAGRELPAVRIAIFDDDDRPCAPCESGEIVVRSDLVMPGYWNRPAANAETLRGGWLHTGDVGYLDGDGYLYVTDRKKDLIISGGSNIYPREVEEVLVTHGAVSEAAVVGGPDEKWGESVIAHVVLRPGLSATEAELIEHCRSHLASYKKPARVEFVDTLPKSAAGKVLKRELREQYWAGRERRV